MRKLINLPHTVAYRGLAAYNLQVDSRHERQSSSLALDRSSTRVRTICPDPDKKGGRW